MKNICIHVSFRHHAAPASGRVRQPTHRSKFPQRQTRLSPLRGKTASDTIPDASAEPEETEIPASTKGFPYMTTGISAEGSLTAYEALAGSHLGMRR